MLEKMSKQSVSCQLTSSQMTYQLEKTGFIDVSACSRHNITVKVYEKANSHNDKKAVLISP